MLKAVGFTDEDLREADRRHRQHVDRDDAVQLQPAPAGRAREAGVRAAGGTPMEFNTIAISDGITMGTEGMKASLVSREVIADSIELVARGHMFDAMVALVGCDKTIPGGGDGAAAARRSRRRALRRLDPARAGSGAATSHPGRVRSGRRERGRQDHGRGAARRSRTAPARRRRLRRTVHGQHDGHGDRVPRAVADGDRRRCRHRPAQGRGRRSTVGGS